MPDLKQQARQLFLDALDEVDVRAAVRRHLRIEASQLRAANASFDLDCLPRILIIAIGKAATPMYEAGAEIFRLAQVPAERLEAIVVSPAPPDTQHGAITHLLGAHPTPDESSFAAARAIFTLLQSATPQTLVIFLISGGASAMVELPRDPGITLPELAAFYRALVGSGLAIGEINALRQRVSAVKSGGLARAAAAAAQLTLVLSDVPGKDLSVVGSGPSSSASTAEIGHLIPRLPHIPPAINRLLNTPAPPRPTLQPHPAVAILTPDDLAQAAQHLATARGFHALIDDTPDDWPVADAAAYLLERSVRLARTHPSACLISVGELSVTLPPNPGRGGRNQHFALTCALALAESHSPITILSAGSDGIDGHSPAAGAVADRHTVVRAQALGLDPTAALTAFDTYPLFETLGDAILTGPTHNNLRDLRLLLT